MNKKQLFWIVPLCIVIGYLFGLYYSIPNTITIDYGDNMLKVTENLKELYNGTMKINNSECPDCICNCDYEDFIPMHVDYKDLVFVDTCK